MLNRLTGHRFALVAALCSAFCVGYFYMLDHVLFSSNQFSPIFRYLLITCDLKAAWAALAVCIVATVWNRTAAILQLVDFLGRHPVALAFASAALLGAGAVAIYHDYPLSMDEYAAVFQSKVFASGSVAAKMPSELIDWLIVRGFNGSFLIGSPESGEVVGAYWPGFAILLAPFEFLHIPWMCNAFVSGLALFLIHWITKEITSDLRCAGWAILFTLASGAFLADGLSWYSMQADLAANLLFAALLIKPGCSRALAAGLIGSFALNLHDPVPHALFAIPWIWAAATQSDRRRYLMPLLAGYLPGIAAGIFWLLFRSDLGSGIHGFPGFSGIASGVFSLPGSAMLNSRAAALIKLSVWATPCLFAFALLGWARYRLDLHARLLAYSAVLTFACYLFVTFDQGHGWGYRYFHSAWGVAPILAGSAMSEKHGSNLRLSSFAGATAILSLLLIVPIQMRQIDQFISRHLAQLGPPNRPGNNVYFIHPLGGFYTADMAQFDPQLRDRDLLLVSHGIELDERLVRENWPGATKVGSNSVADQWYLGREDQRTQFPGSAGSPRFTIAHVPR